MGNTNTMAVIYSGYIQVSNNYADRHSPRRTYIVAVVALLDLPARLRVHDELLTGGVGSQVQVPLHYLHGLL